MKYITYSHRYADVIINADYSIRKEIENIIEEISIEQIDVYYKEHNSSLLAQGKKAKKGKQTALNMIFRDKFKNNGWEVEKNVFGDKTNDLVIDFWKRKVGVDVAFNHRSFIGGDLLRLQAAGEVKNIINIGVYICGTSRFTKYLSASDSSSMVHFERVKWYLKNFYAVLTVPIWLIGLD
ncbi:MAG: restriction endonuclease [Thermosipho sp. (in: Bacteria)]|nr:restriction endonuclease [Thermosipho sp. (in: thermotogales)]